MKQALVLAALVAAVAVTLGSAQASGDRRGRGHRAAVFVQTNEPGGNRILVYDRGRNGLLTPAGSYPTGENGAIATPGTQPDHLASQGSLVYDARHRLLFAVNAGDHSVSTFRVQHHRLRLRNEVYTGGGFPASITVHGNLVYVLNSGGRGIVKGFQIHGNRLLPIRGSVRSLGLSNTNPPNYLTAPAQISFTPNGRMLIVTTKASGSNIDVYRVRPDGRLSANPVVNPSATPVPFGFTFQPSGRLVSTAAAMSNLTTYQVMGNRTLADPRTMSDNQMAASRVVRARGFYYVTNTASNNVSGFEIGPDGQPSLLGANGVVAQTNEGPIDMAFAGTYLYVQTGTAGTIDEFRINDNGTLTQIGVVTGLPVGQEGIAAS